MVSCNPIYFCLQVDVLLRPRLFYKGECLKPDPLTPHWNTFTAPPRTRVPVKAPRPSMRCMLTLTIPKWLEDIVCGHSFWIWSIRTSNSSSPQKDTEEHVLPLIPDFRSHSLVRQASAVCWHYQKSSVCPFGWRYCGATDSFPYEIHVARAVYTAHGVCLATGISGMGMQRFPMLSWAAMYDYFFSPSGKMSFERKVSSSSQCIVFSMKQHQLGMP